MKDSTYYGLASTENSTLRTTDNGKSWEIISLGSANPSAYGNGRLIFGSSENKGLTYSDDGGITKNASNITSGNWGSIIYNSKKDTVYAASLDGQGIVYSKDDGENWYNTNISGNFNSCWLDGDNVCFGSNDGLATLSGTSGNISNKGQVCTSNGIFSTETFNGIDVSIVPVLNKIVAPQIYMEVTGKSFSSEVGDLDLLVEKSRTLYINSSSYSESNIDWENDVGMRPFNATIDDILEDDENYTVGEENVDDTDVMKANIVKVRNYIQYKKNKAIQSMANKVNDCTVDSSNLYDVEGTSSQELMNALETEKMYEDVMKASVISVMTTIYDRIFSFTNSMIRKLIYSGILETLVIVAGDVKKQLTAISKSGATTVTKDDFNINYDFSKGLRVAFDKYLKSLSKQITVVNTSLDKDLIAAAASYYKSVKTNYLDEVNTIVNNITPDITDALNVCNSGLDDYIKTIKNITGNTFSERKEKAITYLNENQTTFDCSDFIEFIFYKFIENLNNSLDINFKYPEDELDSYSLEQKKKILDYLNEIYTKFKERISEYSKYVYDNSSNKDTFISTSNEYLNKSFTNKIKEDINKMTSDEEIDEYEFKGNTYLKFTFEGFLKIYKAVWSASKGLI